MSKRRKRDVELVILSDIHLGTYGCHAEELLRYLKSIKPKKLILNGDIIDMWQFSKRYWPASHMAVVKHITGLLAKGVKIIYLTGNHDEMLRKFAGFRLGNFQIANKKVIQAGGKSAWIFHGDVFDVTMKYSKWLAKLGAVGYDTLIVINTFVNFLLTSFGRGKISLSKKVKDGVKQAVSFINDFEKTAAGIAISNGYDYVVCGHIHHPEMKTITTEHGSAVYLNSGDWVENLTALEFNGGHWRIYRYLDDPVAQSVKISKRFRGSEDNQELFRDLVNEFMSPQKMKILYAIQGTGNGHLSRAVDIIPELKKFGQLDLFVSGAQAEVKLPYPVKYKSKGLSFYFGKSGGINFYKTFQKNSSREVIKEINAFPVERYDLVVNDFEPISAWACKKKEVPCIGLSHQSSLLSKKSPRPKWINPFGEWIIRNYAPVPKYVGFHFEEYDKNIYTPVIRKAISEAKTKDGGHYTVYLPAYDDRKLVKLLLKFPKVRWHIFSKHTKTSYHVGRISVYPVSGLEFSESVLNSTGVLCGAGFETPAEVLHIGKKLLVVPMKSQYEQQCNAAALKKLGVPIVRKVKKKTLKKIESWLDSDDVIDIHFPDVARKAVERAIGKMST